MSTPSAIAGVSALLRELLDRGLRKRGVGGIVGGDVTVSTLAPNRIATDSTEPTQVNLFLHRVTRNTGALGHDLPAFDAKGNRVNWPPLCVDLHYLISVYGSQPLHAEILLGHVIQLLHEASVLTEPFIEAVFHPTPPAPPLPPPVLPFPAAVAACGLEDQSPQVTLSMSPLTTEDVMKLWSAFQAPYRPTVAYTATVVVIDSALSLLPAKEVKTIHINETPAP